MKTLFFLSIFTIGLFYTGTAESKVNDSLYCKCDFYSPLSRAVFERKADSIRTSFHNKYKDVVLIGMRAFAVAKLLFIVNTGNRYRGFSFDMIKMKRIESNGTEVSRMAKMLSENKVDIENSCGIVPTYISHDFSFTVSFSTDRLFHEVCASQLMTVKKMSLATVFNFFMAHFTR